jgi:hypothetical protein
MCKGVPAFSRCDLCDFAHLISLNISLFQLQTRYYRYNVVLHVMTQQFIQALQVQRSVARDDTTVYPGITGTT